MPLRRNMGCTLKMPPAENRGVLLPQKQLNVGLSRHIRADTARHPGPDRTQMPLIQEMRPDQQVRGQKDLPKQVRRRVRLPGSGPEAGWSD